MKLVVKNDEPNAGSSSSTSGATQYISYANKLVKVGTANSASIRPPRPAMHTARLVDSRVTINGETFIRKGRGNKLVRAPSISPAAPAATTASQRGVVNIEGENYVRTKKGICLYFQSDRCKKDEQTCPFIHIKCPDWVEKNNCTRPKCKLPHPPKEKAKTWKSATPLDTPVVSKDEQDMFIKQYVRRPVFDSDAIDESAKDEECSDAETQMAEDEYLSDDDLSGDEAAELLKWYDDNYVEESA
ncbi:hypothetical protein GGH94_000952 [Coemansia aciculifera]|uniref:C3H1-type domain-containing protein n=1 Tax=Coemansia aciculifera TaxID=417176 RepID=A0A9W8IML9_9FUNG|nr:hypothetical protein GGH94_000952 [Coemansia aciculifera]